MSKNDIELPPMPEWAVYQNVENAVRAYARVAIEPYIETLFKIGEHLGIDYHAARTAPGKPSDVYIAAIKAAEQAVLQSPEIQALCKDDERIQFIADKHCMFDTRIQADGTTKYRLGWNAGIKWQDNWFDSPSAAIDAAMEN